MRAIGVLLTACMIVLFHLDSKETQLLAEKKSKEAELATIMEKRKDLELLKGRERQLLQQHGVLYQVMAQRYKAVQVLDVVSQGVHSLQLWLKSLEVEGPRVLIHGYGREKQDIFQFTDFLKKRDVFGSAQLVEIGTDSIQGKSTFHFTLTLLLNLEPGDATANL